MGSGKLLKAAIQKYGKENFHTEILHVVQTEKEMDLLEKILVVPDIEISYNLCNGGKGGWSYLNRTGLNNKNHENAGRKRSLKLKGRKNPENSLRLKERHRLGLVRYDTFIGKTHTNEWKKNHSEVMKNKQKGNLNSQYGTCWITNGQVNKKIKKDELDNWLELGYYKGRI